MKLLASPLTSMFDHYKKGAQMFARPIHNYSYMIIVIVQWSDCWRFGVAVALAGRHVRYVDVSCVRMLYIMDRTTGKARQLRLQFCTSVRVESRRS